MGTDRLNVNSNERIDIGDFRHLAGEGVQAGFRQLGHKFLMEESVVTAEDRTGYILSGFEITNPTLKQLKVTKGKAFLSQRLDGTIVRGVLTTEGDDSITVDLNSYAVDDYGVFIRFEEINGETQGRIHWNPTGNGSEYVQAIPTRFTAKWSLRVESTTPGSEWLRIGTVKQVDMDINDERPFYFEGEVESVYLSGWGSVALGGTANDRDSDRAQYGVGDLHTFVRAMKQCVEDIKGRGLRRWWENDIGGMNIGFDAAPVEDRLAIGDESFFIKINSASDPEMQFDDTGTLDTLRYDRGLNKLQLIIEGVNYHSWTSTQFTTRDLAVSNEVKTALVPSSTYALGGVSNKWGSSHVNSAFIYTRLTMDSGSDVAGSLIPQNDGDEDLGATGTRWRAGYFDQLDISTSVLPDTTKGVMAHLVPSTLNIRNLGTFEKYWRNLYIKSINIIGSGSVVAIGAGASFTGDIDLTGRIRESVEEYLWARLSGNITIAFGDSPTKVTPNTAFESSGITVTANELVVTADHKGKYKVDCVFACDLASAGTVQFSIAAYKNEVLISNSGIIMVIDQDTTHTPYSYTFIADMTDSADNFSIRINHLSSGQPNLVIDDKSQMTVTRVLSTS